MRKMTEPVFGGKIKNGFLVGAGVKNGSIFKFKVSGSLYSVYNGIKISSYDNSLISHLRCNQGVFSY